MSETPRIALAQVTSLADWLRLATKENALRSIAEAIHKARVDAEHGINGAISEIRRGLETLMAAHTDPLAVWLGRGDVVGVAGGGEADDVGQAVGYVEAPTPQSGPPSEEVPAPAPAQPSSKSRRDKPPRIAVCSICRAEFPYTRMGRIPKLPKCGRPTCQPPDATHSGPQRSSRHASRD